MLKIVLLLVKIYVLVGKNGISRLLHYVAPKPAAFKSLDPAKTKDILCVLLIFSQNNMHLLSQFSACNNFVVLHAIICEKF